MKKRLAEAFGLFIIVVAGSVILKITAAFIGWIPYSIVLEIGLLASLMWLAPLGLIPAKKFVVKATEKWKDIDI